jgi:anaerobic selenocysteine-containing dehydrogenase
MASGFDRDFPDGVKRITTGCQYCAVGCGYNAFLTPHAEGPNHLPDAPRFITPAMQPVRSDTGKPETTAKVFYNGVLKDIAVAPDPRCDLNKGNHSVRGASQGLNLVAYREKSNGAAGHEQVGRSTKERLTSPWVRLDSGTWKEVTWETVNKVMARLVVAATNMKASGTPTDTVEVNNPRGLGVKLYEYQYLENTYAATKLFYGAIGTPNVAFHDRPSASGSSPGLKDAGLRPHDFSYEDVQAADLVIMIGTNPYENQSVFFMQYCQGKEIWVIDPRKTATAEYAVRTGGGHIQPTRLGADSRLIYAICRALIERWEDDHDGQLYPTMLEIGDTDNLTRDPVATAEKKRQASRAKSYADFKEFLGTKTTSKTYDLAATMKATGLSEDDQSKLRQLVEAILDASAPGATAQKKVAVLYEKGMIWGFNYHNTAALASLGVLLGAGSEPGRILGRVGGHQKGWAERVEPLDHFAYPGVPRKYKCERYPTHNATDLYTDDFLKRRFPEGESAEYIKPKHNLDNHVFGPLKGKDDPHKVLADQVRRTADGTTRSFERVQLPNGLETDKQPDVKLLWIIGGNYLGQTNDVAWKRLELHKRMKAGRPVNPRRPKNTDTDEIVRALTQRMADGGLVCVHQDIFANPTTECCDIVIPAAGWGEETFCRYNAQRRLKLYERFQDMPMHENEDRKPGIDPYSYIGEFKHSPKPDWMIIKDIAQSIGTEIGSRRFETEFPWTDSAAVADEMAEASHRGPDHPKGMGLKNLFKFADAQNPDIPNGRQVHTLLGASELGLNDNAETQYLKSNYVVSETINCTDKECTALGAPNTSGVYTNGVATNGVFLPLTTKESDGDTQLVGHLSVRREGPAFYFVAAPWQEIEDAFNRINSIADDADWRAQGGVLVTNGRVNHLWNNMFHHIRNDYVNDRYPEDMPGTVVEINPAWADCHAIENGDIVRLSRTPLPDDHPAPHDAGDAQRNFRDIVYGVASLQDSVPDGMAFLMFSYPVGEGRHAFNFNFNGYVNNITDGHADGINPIAALKYGHGILTKVPVDQSGYPEGKFASMRDRPGPLYEQRNVVGPGGIHDQGSEVGSGKTYATRSDWEMRELIVRKGLPRASAHSGKKGQLFFQPDDFYDALKNNRSLEDTGPLRDGFRSGAIGKRRWMRWSTGGSLVDEWHGADVYIGANWLEQFPPAAGAEEMQKNETGDTQMIDFARVQQILDDAVGGPGAAIGAHGTFWRGATRDQFINMSVFGLKLIELGDGNGSNLVKALRGESPFDGSSFRRMPAGMGPVSVGMISEIADWISTGAPEHQVASVGVPSSSGTAPNAGAIDGSKAVAGVKQYRIHPGIGISRLGTSREDFFVGPEAPGIPPLPNGQYRDAGNDLKRQAARFRIYEYEHDVAGRLISVRELTAADAEITWTVRMVNRKSEAGLFPPNGNARNAHVANRQSLIIDSKEQHLIGPNRSASMSGMFKGSPVNLGDIQTDDDGRLLVLGGFGISRSVPSGTVINNFANNDNWHDDVSDGPVSATITFPGGPKISADPAWAIVAPPAYAPSINNVLTMYDQAWNAAVTSNPNLIPTRVSFTRDVYPILKRTVVLQWVSSSSRSGHRSNSSGDFLESNLLSQLSNNSDTSRNARRNVFNRLNNPDNTGGGGMPFLLQGLDPDNPSTRVPTALTQAQYEVMDFWQRGLFDADWPGQEPEPVPFSQIPVEEQPAALDRASLEAGIGGPFFPGIECGFIQALTSTYRAPFRIDASNVSPGDVTAGLAVPWQADFLACGTRWWPAQRPNSVSRDGTFQAWTPPSWTPPFPQSTKYEEMVANWWRLGLVVKDGDAYVERERLLGEDGEPLVG